MEQLDAYSALEAVYNTSELDKIKKLHIAVFGLGGVGSFASLAFVRCGVGFVKLVDQDTIDSSNINRQEFAFQSTIGKRKVDIAKHMVLDINPNVNINVVCQHVSPENVDILCSKVDGIVDAIDDVEAKIALAKYAQENSIKYISSMGMAMRIHPEKLTYSSIYNTKNCPFAKRVRHASRQAGLNDYPVVVSEELPRKKMSNILGSNSFVPPVAGFLLSSYIINSFIGAI